MKTALITRFILVATLVFTGYPTVYADELREQLAQQNASPVYGAADIDYQREFAVGSASIGDTESVLFSGYVAPVGQCVCSNLNSVTVICEDCDRALDASQCFTHDRACQDAAQAGGIREHQTFFCTNPD